MLARVLEEIPMLTESVVRAGVQGNGSADLAPEADCQANGAKAGAPRQVRKAPLGNAPRAPPTMRWRPKGLPMPGYEKLTADEIIGKLSERSAGRPRQGRGYGGGTTTAPRS